MPIHRTVLARHAHPLRDNYRGNHPVPSKTPVANLIRPVAIPAAPV